MIIEIIVGLWILFISFIDVKEKEVPSILTTSIILFLGIVNMQNLAYGIFASVFALLLYEFGFIKGLADIKVLAIVGLMINSLPLFLIFMLLTVVFGTVFKILMVKVRKKKQTEMVSFIPVFFFVYLGIILIKLMRWV